VPRLSGLATAQDVLSFVDDPERRAVCKKFRLQLLANDCRGRVLSGQDKRWLPPIIASLPGCGERVSKIYERLLLERLPVEAAMSGCGGEHVGDGTQGGVGRHLFFVAF